MSRKAKKTKNQSDSSHPRELATGMPLRRYVYRAVVGAILLVLGFRLYLSVPGEQSQVVPAEAFFRCPCPQVFAHRGASYYMPGNTIEAFRLALRQGADILELDVQRTKDGHLVVAHDRNLKRKTGVDLLVADSTLARVQQLDAGFSFRPPTKSPSARGDFPFRGKGIRIPTLQSVLRTFPGTRINIEIKDSEPVATVRTLYRVIMAEQALKRVLVGGVSSAGVDEWARLTKGRGARGASMKRVLMAQVYYRLGGVWRPDYHALQVPYRMPAFMLGMNMGTAGYVRFAARRGVRVHYWTVNLEKDMERLYRIGAHGVMTDRPDLARRVLVRLGLRKRTN